MNTNLRLTKYDTIIVNTVSLNDLCEQHFRDRLDYLSVDTEGSELEILSSFDFYRYRPTVLTVEHNFLGVQQDLDQLLARHEYVRVFGLQSQFDAWYVLRDAAKSAGLI